jgi:replicative DNA helicase
MQTKLTLRLEESLIQQAKSYAKEHDKSLSQVVADYFQILTQQTNKPVVSPITKSLIGVIDSSGIDKKYYKKHLEEKYL